MEEKGWNLTSVVIQYKMKRTNEPRLGLKHNVFAVGFTYTGKVSWFESESRDSC